MNDVPVDHRCLKCFRGTPEVEFGTSSGRPNDICTECAHQVSAQRNQERSELQDTKKLTQFISATLSSKIAPSDWQDMTMDLMGRFGGATGLGEKIYAQIDQILVDKPGSALSLKALQFVCKLIRQGMEEKTAELQVSNMTDDQLNDAVDRYLTSRFNVKLPTTDDDSD